MSARRGCFTLRSTHGKTVRVCATITKGRIEHLTITGDFFGEPVEAFRKLADELIGLGADDAEEIRKKVSGFLKENVKWIEGISEEDLGKAILECIRRLSEN